MKAFTNDKPVKEMIFVSDKVGNIVEKRGKCRLPAFSPLPSMFSKSVLLRAVKSWNCLVKR